MRTSRIVMALALVGLVAGGIGLAFAQDNTTTPGSAAPAASDRPCAPAANETRNAAFVAWRESCVRNMTEYRRMAIESFNENRTLALLAHDDNLSRIRTTFLDGKLAAYKDCLAQAAPFGRNASGPHSGVLASCMKDRLEPLRQAALASHQGERQALADALKAAKADAKTSFAQNEQSWLAANPRP